jgi:hypothetical protein
MAFPNYSRELKGADGCASGATIGLRSAGRRFEIVRLGREKRVHLLAVTVRSPELASNSVGGHLVRKDGDKICTTYIVQNKYPPVYEGVCAGTRLCLGVRRLWQLGIICSATRWSPSELDNLYGGEVHRTWRVSGKCLRLRRVCAVTRPCDTPSNARRGHGAHIHIQQKE